MPKSELLYQNPAVRFLIQISLSINFSYSKRVFILLHYCTILVKDLTRAVLSLMVYFNSSILVLFAGEYIYFLEAFGPTHR